MTMRLRLTRPALASIALIVALALPTPSLAADVSLDAVGTGHLVSSTTLPDGTTLTLEAVGVTSAPRGIMAGGSANAGCQITAYDHLGWVIYSYTIWQSFSYSGTVITSFPPESTSSVAYWGWVITADSHSHWWVSNPTRAAARGNYTFTQYVGGQPFQSRSGWVQVNISGAGSWTCSGS